MLVGRVPPAEGLGADVIHYINADLEVIADNLKHGYYNPPFICFDEHGQEVDRCDGFAGTGCNLHIDEKDPTRVHIRPSDPDGVFLDRDALLLPLPEYPPMRVVMSADEPITMGKQAWSEVMTLDRYVGGWEPETGELYIDMWAFNGVMA